MGRLLIHTIPHRREIGSSSLIWEVHPSKVAPSGPMWVHAALDQAVAIEHRMNGADRRRSAPSTSPRHQRFVLSRLSCVLHARMRTPLARSRLAKIAEYELIAASDEIRKARPPIHTQ